MGLTLFARHDLNVLLGPSSSVEETLGETYCFLLVNFVWVGVIYYLVHDAQEIEIMLPGKLQVAISWASLI